MRCGKKLHKLPDGEKVCKECRRAYDKKRGREKYLRLKADPAAYAAFCAADYAHRMERLKDPAKREMKNRTDARSRKKRMQEIPEVRERRYNNVRQYRARKLQEDPGWAKRERERFDRLDLIEKEQREAEHAQAMAAAPLIAARALKLAETRASEERMGIIRRSAA